MLSQQEEWLVNHALDGQHRTTCPWCSPHRKKKHDLCLSVWRDHSCIKFNCHHGDCGVSGLIPLNRKDIPLNIEAPKITERRKIEEFGPLSQEQQSWLQSRNISIPTAQKYHLVGSENKWGPAVGFPYFEGGYVVSLKKRAVREKAFTCWQSPNSFFGIEHVNVGDDLYIVEGEMDVLAMSEAGFNAVSIPNGASTVKLTDGKLDPENDRKFNFLWKAKPHIDAAKRIVIAMDADKVGEAYADELARRIGKERCWKIKYPEGIKDANECVIKLGKEKLHELVEEAPPWPIQGLYDAAHFSELLWEIYEKGIGRGESTGFENLDELYTVVPGQLTVVTGLPNSGKSSFVDHVMVNLAENKGWSFAVCSFENEPRFHISKLMSIRASMPFFEGPRPRMNREEAKAAFDWVNDNFAFIHQEDGGLSTLDSILTRLKIAIMRYGIRGAVIDPYSFIDRDNKDMSETDWISLMLTKVKAFAMAHGIHVWFVAHPTKMPRGTDGNVPPPKGYDIAGSGHWFAKCDCGLTIHRDPERPGVTKFISWKCRFSWVGMQGEAELLYDVPTMRYSPSIIGQEDRFEI